MVEAAIIELLVQKGFFVKEAIVSQHSFSLKSNVKLTGRKRDFVSGYR
jgi:hypothetical protein